MIGDGGMSAGWAMVSAHANQMLAYNFICGLHHFWILSQFQI